MTLEWRLNAQSQMMPVIYMYSKLKIYSELALHYY